MAEQGAIPRDPLKESIGLELDMINILYVASHPIQSSHNANVIRSIRLVQILAMQQNRRK